MKCFLPIETVRGLRICPILFSLEMTEMFFTKTTFFSKGGKFIHGMWNSTVLCDSLVL